MNLIERNLQLYSVIGDPKVYVMMLDYSCVKVLKKATTASRYIFWVQIQFAYIWPLSRISHTSANGQFASLLSILCTHFSQNRDLFWWTFSRVQIVKPIYKQGILTSISLFYSLSFLTLSLLFSLYQSPSQPVCLYRPLSNTQKWVMSVFSPQAAAAVLLFPPSILVCCYHLCLSML